jgi:hypothetical protein
MSEQEQSKKEIRSSARLFDRIGWGILLLCAVDIVLNLDLLGPEMSVFLTALAATLLIIGIIVRKQASK